MTGVGADPILTISIIEIQPDGEKRIELHCNIGSCLTPTYEWRKDGAVYVKINKSNNCICISYLIVGYQLRGQRVVYLLFQGLI